MTVVAYVVKSKIVFRRYGYECNFHTGNRQRLLNKLEEGSIAFFYSGVVPIKGNDQYMNPFSVNRNFYYLTDIDTQNVWLVMSKTARGTDEILFIDQIDEEIINWNGKMLTREGRAKSVEEFPSLTYTTCRTWNAWSPTCSMTADRYLVSRSLASVLIVFP